MQEAPNFNTYLSRFRNVDRNTVLDSREVISGSDRKFLESLYDRLDLYFDDQSFRSQLTIEMRTTIEDSYLTTILSYLENLASWQRDGSTVINGANLTGQIQSINSILTAVDQQLSGYYFTYLSATEPLGKKVQTIQSLVSGAEQESQTLHDIVENIKTQVNDRKQSYDTVLSDLQTDASVVLEQQKAKGEDVLASTEKVLTQAKLLIGRASGHQLGDYYHKLANGRTSGEQDQYTKNKGKGFEKFLSTISSKKIIIGAAVLLPLSYSVLMFLAYNPIQLNIWTSTLLIVFAVAFLVTALTFVVLKSIKHFSVRFKGGHERTSVLWMAGAILSTIATAVYSGILIRDLTVSGPITWEEIIPKIIVLLAPAYLVRLCVQNYRANAHLAVQYMHRATIMNIAESYSAATSVDASQSTNSELVKISHEARMMILTDAAKIMFAQSESGYITQKEGAGGNGDNMIESLQRK